MKITKITLEDQGQDLLELYVSEDEVVIDALPFQGHIWKGAMIPISDESMVKVGARCPIHNPPYIEYGFLKYNIEAIEEIEQKVLKCCKCGSEINGGYYNSPMGPHCCDCWKKVDEKQKKAALSETLMGLAALGMRIK